ncbi:MAG: DUF6165 family protein [Rhodospirillales bacterium]
MPATLSIEISPGELIDKITILEIKLDRMSDAAKLANVKAEWDLLTASRDAAIPASDELQRLSQSLKEVNVGLWVIEDYIRQCEREKDFGKKFIELARSVYINNDDRARLKREINELLGSRLVEEKSYAVY